MVEQERLQNDFFLSMLQGNPEKTNTTKTIERIESEEKINNGDKKKYCIKFSTLDQILLCSVLGQFIFSATALFVLRARWGKFRSLEKDFNFQTTQRETCRSLSNEQRETNTDQHGPTCSK